MKVLVAHNRYRSDLPSGENMVVDNEIDLLRDAGVDVVTMLTESDAVTLRSPRGAAAAAMGPVYAPAGVPQLRRLIERERPDVLHLHNVYPLLSPWVVRTAHARQVPVVQTIHNFRQDCVAGTYFRDGAICTDCAGKALGLPAITHGCYRGSRAQSVPMAIGRTVHRSTWRSVDRFLALTPFHAEFLATLGVERRRIVVRPTSAPDPGPATPPPNEDVLFVGRLEDQKGVRLLLDAWRTRINPTGAMLQFAGTGPLSTVVDDAAAHDASIVFHGLASPEKVADLMRGSGVVVIPSTWFEGLPRVLVEALSHGRAVAVTDIGGLGASVPNAVGWRFKPNAAALASVLDTIDATGLHARGESARDTYLSKYAAAVTTDQLLDVYTDLAGSRS